jgi:hypothetical protein
MPAYCSKEKGFLWKVAGKADTGSSARDIPLEKSAIWLKKTLQSRVQMIEVWAIL